MAEREHELGQTSSHSVEDADLNVFVEDVRRWRRHADLGEKADDAHLLSMFLDVGKAVRSLAERQRT